MVYFHRDKLLVCCCYQSWNWTRLGCIWRAAAYVGSRQQGSSLGFGVYCWYLITNHYEWWNNMWSADFLSASPWTSWKMKLRSMVWGIWDHDDTLRSQLERWFWSYFIFRWSLESQIIWGCDGVRACSDLLTREPLKLLNIVICTDIHKDTHIGFQWIRGLRLKQLKKTHTYACTHSWFIFIASHKLTAGHWQSAFVQSAITAWQRASIYGESAGQDDSGGARAAKSL